MKIKGKHSRGRPRSIWEQNKDKEVQEERGRWGGLVPTPGPTSNKKYFMQDGGEETEERQEDNKHQIGTLHSLLQAVMRPAAAVSCG
jgi:hypothetical protein